MASMEMMSVNHVLHARLLVPIVTTPIYANHVLLASSTYQSASPHALPLHFTIPPLIHVKLVPTTATHVPQMDLAYLVEVDTILVAPPV